MDSYSSTDMTTQVPDPSPEGANSRTGGRQHTIRHFRGLGIPGSFFHTTVGASKGKEVFAAYANNTIRITQYMAYVNNTEILNPEYHLCNRVDKIKKYMYINVN